MKKRSRFILCLLIFCMGIYGFQLTGWAEEKSGEKKLYIYNVNKDATQLETMEYVPDSSELDFIFSDLIARFGSKNSEERVSNLLPQEVNINSYELRENILNIDFNSQYSKMNRTREILVRAGIVKTFVQLQEVEAVKFTVFGAELTDSKQIPIGNMTEETFVEYSATQDQSNYRPEILTLYFTNADGSGLVEEKRKVYYKPNLQKERVVLEQLIKGPMEKGNYPTLLDGISVLGIFISDDICYVNLSENFTDSAAALDARIPVYSIVNSLVDSCGATRVEIEIEGNRDVIVGDNLSLYQFYDKNNELILPVKIEEEDE